MRSLRRGGLNNRTEVRFYQAALNLFNDANLVVDGSYGRKTESGTCDFQRSRGLPVTGKADKETLNALGFRTTHNPGIVLWEIPFERIEEAHVLAKDRQKYSVTRFAKEGGYDIVWNGAFFRGSTRAIGTFIMIDGEVKHWGMGYKGIAYDSPFTRAEGDLYGAYIHKPYDIQGGAPVLIDKYRRNEKSIYDFKARSAEQKANYNSRKRRNCTGHTKNSLILMFSIVNLTMDDMIKEGLLQRDIAFLQNNDGGGSQSLSVEGSLVISTDGRFIPAAVGLKLKLRR